MNRTNILPKTISDAFVTAFVVAIIPTVYWFELFIVLPTFYDQWSASYNFHFTCGTIILFNLTANFYGTIVTETSIKGKVLPTSMLPNWRFCSVCESIAPPRSWHCTTCNICILKRDHHCMFTSCCIGHYNQRYFLMFVLYVFAATLYATYFNSFFIYENADFSSLTSFIKIIFPLATLVIDSSRQQVYWFLYLIVIICTVFTGVLSYFHVNLMLKGIVTHERDHKLSGYDFGKMQNVREVLGDRWYLVWLLPFISSNLPHDGVNWSTKYSFKGR